MAGYVVVHKKVLRPEYLEKLEAELQQFDVEMMQVAASAASLMHSIEGGKAVVTSAEWLEMSALAELTLVRMTFAIGDPVTRQELRQVGAEWIQEQQAKAARGQAREYPMTNLVRCQVVREAMRAGGQLIRDSHERPEWLLFTAQVGNGGELALMGLSMVSRLLGAMHIRHLQGADEAEVQFFKFMSEAHAGTDRRDMFVSRLQSVSS